MRRVGLRDLDLAARMIMALPDKERATAVAQMLAATHTADCVRKATGRPAPDGGTGALCVQARLIGPVAPSDATPEYCAALSHVLDGLATFRKRHHTG